MNLPGKVFVFSPLHSLSLRRSGPWCLSFALSVALLPSARAQRPSPPASPRAAQVDEVGTRLQRANAARDSGDPAQIVPSNGLLIASALNEMAGLRDVEQAYPQAIVLYKDSLQWENTPTTLLGLATVDAEAGHYDEAIALARSVHAAAPTSGPLGLQADRILSSSLLQKGDFVAALEPLSRVAQADSGVETQYALANCLLQTKRPADKIHAEAVFKQIETEHGDTGSLHVLTGRSYRDAGDLPGATREFQRALQIDPKTPHAHYFLGLARLSANEWRPTPEAETEIRTEAELFPQDYLANYMTGFLASGERRYDEAEPFLKTASKLDPSAPEPDLYLGLNAYAKSDMPAAEAALRKAVELTGTDEARSNYQIRRAYVDLGRILANSGRKDESETFLSKARELQNKTMEQSQQSIASMAGAGMNAAAVLPLATPATSKLVTPTRTEETATLDPAAVPGTAKLSDAQRHELAARETQLRDVLALAYNDLGTTQAVQGNFSAAIDLYRKAEDWNPSLPGLEKNLGQSEFRAGHYEGAVSPLTQALLREPGSRGLRAMLGITYFDLNRFPEAARTFAPLGQDGMQDTEVGYAWAASLARSGDLVKATEVLKTYAATPRPAEVGLLVGQLWTTMGDYPRALATLQQALAGNASLPKLHLAMGMAYLRTERWPDAAREFQAELAAHPGDPDAQYHLGFVEMQQTKVDDAVALFEQVIAAHPGYANAQYQLGKIQLDRGQVETAIGHLQAAELASPGTDYIHYQLQAAYRKVSRTADADKELAIYKQLKATAREQAAERVVAH